MGQVGSGRDSKFGGAHAAANIQLPAQHDPFQAMVTQSFGKVFDAVMDGLEADVRRRFSEPLGQRETDNLRQHVERVREIEGDEFAQEELTRSQRKRVTAWMDDAAEHNEKDDKRSAAKWQAILSEIMGRNDEVVVDAIRELNVYDVMHLAEIDEDTGKLPAGVSSRFSSMGLVEPRTLFSSISIFPLLIIITVTATTLSSLAIINIDILAITDAILISIFLTGILISSVLVRVVGIVDLTPLGKDVKSKIDKYMR